MKEKLNIELTVPMDWTGREAHTVWEFLESIMNAVSEVHGDEIEQVTDSDSRRTTAREELSPKEIDDSDYPF